MENIPIIEYYITDEFDNTDLFKTSIVDEPAIEKSFQMFRNEKKQEMFKSVLKFSSVNEEKRILSGPVMIPNKEIYRNNPVPHYCVFSEESIRNAVYKSSKQGNLNNMNFMHSDEEDSQLKSAVLLESYFLQEDKDDLPKGTWIASWFIEDEEEWQYIKDNKLTGFSVEVNVSVDIDAFKNIDFKSDERDEVLEMILKSNMSKKEKIVILSYLFETIHKK
jgi:hypothetical protein